MTIKINPVVAAMLLLVLIAFLANSQKCKTTTDKQSRRRTKPQRQRRYDRSNADRVIRDMDAEVGQDIEEFANAFYSASKRR